MNSPTDHVQTTGSEQLHPAKTVIAAWIAARVISLAAVGVSRLNWFDQFTSSTPMNGRGLLLWDGENYRNLVDLGYSGMAPDIRRFFPGFHTISGLVHDIFGLSATMSVVLVANASAFGAMWLLFRLVQASTTDQRLPALAVWWLALLPASQVFTFAYSEATAVMFALAALLALKRGNLALTFLFGMALGLTRSVGLLLALPLLWDMAPRLREDLVGLRSRATRAKASVLTLAHGAVVASPVIGTATYFVWNSRTFGSSDIVLDAQREFRGPWHEPVSRLAIGIFDTLNGDFVDVYNVAFALGCVLVLIVARKAIPLGWTMYLLASLLVALASTNINSLGRYIVAAFPLAVACAVTELKARERYPSLSRVLLPVSALCGFGYSLVALSGRMIP